MTRCFLRDRHRCRSTSSPASRGDGVGNHSSSGSTLAQCSGCPDTSITPVPAAALTCPAVVHRGRRPALKQGRIEGTGFWEPRVGDSVGSETHKRPHARDQCRLRQPQRGHDVLHVWRDADGRRDRVVVKTLDALAVADGAELRRDQRADLRAG